MIALYDLRHRITTYDYFTWQVHVHALGATQIVFRDWDIVSKKWPVEEAKKRYDNYIRPGPALSGLPSRTGSDGDGEIGSYNIQDVHNLVQKAGIRLPRLKSVLPPAGERYTVTIRQTFHNAHKNSDIALWRWFARKIGAKVIEDSMVHPIGLHERMALYAGAKMNFGVPNGPLAMLYLTEYPLTVFCNPATTAKGFSGHGMKPGDQVPFFLPNQRLIWERPTADNMMRQVEEMAAC